MASADVSIRTARVDEIDILRAIEVAAGQQFATLGMTYVSDDLLPSVAMLGAYQQKGRAWVAVDTDDRAVAYLIADLIDGQAHVEQVSVDPAWSRRGIGRRLLERLAEWALDQGCSQMTLTTFADVPWNAPYYRRCGFSEVSKATLGPELAALWAEEQAHGLGRDRRVVMSRSLSR